VLVEIQRDKRKRMNINRTKLLKKYNIEKKESFDQLIEEFKQKVSAKTQQLSRYRKRQNQYYQNKLFRTDCKKFYNHLWQTNPNVKNSPDKVEVVTVLRHSFGIINWRIEEIKQIDRKTRKMLTMYKMHHPKADIDTLYVKRKERGRGLVQVEVAYKAEIINISEYLNTNYNEDQFVNVV
jgi:hypothetical protein